MKKYSLLVGLSALFLLVGAGCSKTPVTPVEDGGTTTTPTTQDTSPIKVGVIVPLSGDASVYGVPGQKIINLAAEEINTAGGINGRKMEFIFEDGKCTGKDAATAMQKLATVDKVKFVIGGFCSGESVAAAPIANTNKILLFSPGSSSPDLTTKGGEFFLRNYPSDAFQGVVLADAAITKKAWKKIAVIQEQTDYADALFKTFETKVKELGGQIVVEKFASSVTDFRTSLTKLKEGKPDALFLVIQTPQQGELILKQLAELKWSVSLIGSDLIADTSLLKTQPELYEGTIIARFGYNEAAENFKKFVVAYKTKYNNEDVPFLSYAQTEYDAVYMLADAFKAVGSDDSVKVRDWLKSSKGWTGVSGVVEFDANGDRSVGGHKLEVIKAGKVVPFEG